MSTLKEVAELAGVSVATASLALNHNARIKESTRKKVSACAKALNYVPNRIGRTLKNGKSNAIAVLAMTSTRYADIVHETALLYYCLEGVLSITNSGTVSIMRTPRIRRLLKRQWRGPVSFPTARGFAVAADSASVFPDGVTSIGAGY